MALLPEIRNRRSIRRFKPVPLESPVLARIVEAGRRAPSAKNRQAWRFVVVTDADLRAKLESAAFGQEYVGQAPAVIALCTTNIEYTMPNGQASYPIDLGIAAAFMMLQAEHEGAATCPITTFSEEEVKVLLSVPYRMRVVMLLLVGLPDESPELTPRLPVERLVGYDHW